MHTLYRREDQDLHKQTNKKLQWLNDCLFSTNEQLKGIEAADYHSASPIHK